MRPTRFSILAVLVVGLSMPSRAAEFVVGAGSSLDLGSAALDLGCTNLTVGGTLNAGSAGITDADDLTIGAAGVVNGESATISVTGDWVNDAGGTFNAGTSIVYLVDGCGNSSSTIMGSTTFSTLNVLSSTGKSYAFEAGATQTIGVELMISGVEENRLVLGSTSPGNEAIVNLQGTADIDWVTVGDIHGVPNRLVFGPNSVVGTNVLNVGQCGDLDGDFVTDAIDVTMAQEFLVGKTIAGDPTLCNVIGPYDALASGADCEIDDVYILQRIAAGETVYPQNGCAP